MLAGIDRRHDAASSIVLRYRGSAILNGLAPARLDDSALDRLSVREGVRTFTLFERRGVEIVILDETTLMHTRSLKSIDGCITTARCLAAGYDRVCFESGGNTGTALTTYMARAGVETFCFVPAANLPLLSAATFDAPTSHLIAVDDPAAVKAVAAAFSRASGVPRVPRREWRSEASTLLGCFVLEQMAGGARFDYLYQTISAAFAPLGIYRVLKAGGITALPIFVGVQQAARCQMTRQWLHDTGGVLPADDTTPLSAVMYDAAPGEYGTYPDLARLVAETRGWLTTLHSSEFEALGEAMDALRRHDLHVTERDGVIVDRTGLIALARALLDVEAGRLRPGSRVLVCVTGGTATPDGRAVPDVWLHDRGERIDDVVRHFPLLERRSA